jgi:hypothetical protein
LPGFTIGAPVLTSIGPEQLLSTQTETGAFQIPEQTAVIIGPVRPPLKPPPFATELSSLETEAAHVALRSFILDATVSAGSSPMRMSLSEAHWSLGHVSYDSLLSWEKAGTLRADGIILTDHRRVSCERCKGANARRHSSPAVSAHRPTDIMHTISWDLFGRTRISGVGNTRYFNVGRDRACGWAWTRPLTYKSQAAAHCISTIRFEQKQTGAHVKVFQCDGGGEYMGPRLK